MLLWITYGVFILRRAPCRWIPYLVLPDAERAARYQIIFAGTHSFLPRRNGIAPDTSAYRVSSGHAGHCWSPFS